MVPYFVEILVLICTCEHPGLAPLLHVPALPAYFAKEAHPNHCQQLIANACFITMCR